MQEESLTHEQFLAWTLSNNTSPSIQYILKHRVVKGEVQYLVRYMDTKNFPYDAWISSSRITNMQPIISYINKQNPSDLKPNLDPKEQPHESDDEITEIHIKHAKANTVPLTPAVSQKIRILELIDDNHFKVIYPGNTKIEDATREDLIKNYKEEFLSLIHI